MPKKRLLSGKKQKIFTNKFIYQVIIILYNVTDYLNINFYTIRTNYPYIPRAIMSILHISTSYAADQNPGNLLRGVYGTVYWL